MHTQGGTYDLLARYLPRDLGDATHADERSWRSIRGDIVLTGGQFRAVNYTHLGQPVLVLGNGVDPVFVWDGSGNLKPLTPSPPVAPRGNQPALLMERLFLAGIAGEPQSVYYSALYDPGGWAIANSPTSPMAAGYQRVPTWDGDGVRAIVPAQGGLLVFKSRTVWRLTSGSPRLMQLLQVDAPTGVPSADGVASIGLQVYWIGRGGLWRWQGGGVVVAFGKELASFWDSTDRARLDRATLTAHDGRLYVALYGSAQSTGRDVVLEVDAATGLWTVRRGIAPIDGWHSAGDRLLCFSAGQIRQLSQDGASDGAALRWQRFCPDDPTGRKRVRQIVARGSGAFRIVVQCDEGEYAVTMEPGVQETLCTARLELTGRLLRCAVEGIEGRDIALRSLEFCYEEVD